MKNQPFPARPLPLYCRYLWARFGAALKRGDAIVVVSPREMRRAGLRSTADLVGEHGRWRLHYRADLDKLIFTRDPP